MIENIAYDVRIKREYINDEEVLRRDLATRRVVKGVINLVFPEIISGALRVNSEGHYRK